MCAWLGECVAARLTTSERTKVVLPQPDAPNTTACPRGKSTTSGICRAAYGLSTRPTTGRSAWRSQSSSSTQPSPSFSHFGTEEFRLTTGSRASPSRSVSNASASR